jgi:hypothetical protein
MIEFVWHSLVYWTISNDIYNISLSVSCQYSWEWNCTVLSEAFLEKISRLRPITMMVRHLYYPY